MGMPATVRRRWTRADVLGLMEATPFHWPRYEVVDGELLVTPAPGGLYAFAVDELHASLHAYVEMTGIGHALTSPSDVELKRGVLVQPDLYVIPKAEAPRLRRDNKCESVRRGVIQMTSGQAHVSAKSVLELRVTIDRIEFRAL